MLAHTRRNFIQVASAAVAGALLPAGSGAALQQPAKERQFCAFTKLLHPLSYADCADQIAELGLDGVEATVRQGSASQPGQVLPERVEEDLPKLVEALKKRNLELMILTSDINEVNPLNEKVLRTAASLGVKRYRMAYYSYRRAPGVGVRQRLAELKPKVLELAALNRQLGITGMVKNSGSGMNVGGSMWDLAELLQDVPTKDVGVVLDVRHFGVDSLITWPIRWEIVQPYLAATNVHDGRSEGGRLIEVPLGEGIVDKRLFQQLGTMSPEIPISIHVEYLQRGSPAEIVSAIRRDSQTLKRLMEA
jgi:sugar phosphate isomerase/epimerase